MVGYYQSIIPTVLLQCAPLAVSLQQQLMSAYYNRHLHASNQTSARV